MMNSSGNTRNSPIVSYVDYLRRIAKAHRDIADFKYLDFAMLQGAMNTGNVKFPVLMADTVKGSFADMNMDTPIQVMEGGFGVFFPVPPENYEEELAALEESHRIGLEILDRMEMDQEREGWFLYGFDRNKAKWEAAGPICDSLFGVLFSFRVCLGSRTSRNPAEIWNDMQR